MQDKNFTERIYNEHALNVKKYLFTITKDTYAIDEAICETFVAFVCCNKNFADNEIYLRNWLYKVAANKLRDYYRKNKRVLKNECELHEEAFELTYEFLGEVELKEENIQIRQAIRKLPKKQRDAVFHHFIECLSYEEISRFYGGNSSTIRVNCMKGLNNLKNKLKFLKLE